MQDLTTGSLTRPSAQDHQLHAGHDGLPDAVRPGRSLLGRPAGHGRGRGGRHRRQPDRSSCSRSRRCSASARRRSCRTPRAARITPQAHLPVQPVAGPVDGRRASCSSRSAMALRDGVRRRARAPTRARRRWPRSTCCGSSRRWRCSSRMVAMGAALRGTGNFKPGMIVQTGDGHPQHRAGAVADLRLGHRSRRWASAARRSRRSSRSSSASVVDLVLLRRRDAYLRFHFADWKPQLRGLGAAC